MRGARFVVAAVIALAGLVAGVLVLAPGSDDEPEQAAAPADADEAEAPATPADDDPDLSHVSFVATALDEVSEVAVYESEEAAEPFDVLPNPTKNGGPQVFLLDGQDVGGARHHVLLPIEPNGSTGWIDVEDVELSQHAFRVTVTLSEHHVELTEGGETLFETQVAVGDAGRETPTGVYYTKELLQPPDPDGVYGTFAYGLSGFTNNPEVAEQFGDGGVIGIHGTNRPDLIGTDVSAGCIRMTNEDINQLVQTVQLPLGVPVEIRA